MPSTKDYRQLHDKIQSRGTMRRYSHSAIKVWQRCQRKWYYKYIRRLDTTAEKPALERGKTLHEGLELYHTLSPDFAQWMLDADPDDRDILVRYAEKYEDDDLEWDIISSETEYEFNLGPYTLVVIPDLVVRIAGELWVVDHKTTKTIPDEWDPYNMTDFQHLLYLAAMQQAYPEETIGGFIFNYVRTKPPTMPKLIKDGSRIANVRALDTTYKILEDFAKATGTLDGDTAEKLKILKHAPDRYFQRHFLPVSQAAVDAAVKDIWAVVSDMSARETGRVGRTTYARHVLAKGTGYAACTFCEYQPICHQEMMGIEVDLDLLGYVERPERESNEGTT